MARIKGVARVDKRTKDLAKRLQPGDIAVIDHRDIDEVSAESLVGTHIRAVVNADSSISGRYPNQGPAILMAAGVVVLDEAGQGVMTAIKDGDMVEIDGDSILANGVLVGYGKQLTPAVTQARMEAAKANLGTELDKFVENTLEYAKREKSLILGGVPIPDVGISFRNRHALIVVRGKDYREDLLAIRGYIKEMRPVIIGVDGGADALREMGYTPDIIIGDMDSVSDETLMCGAALVVHAYPDGRAPGMARLERLGLRAMTFPAPGTSEDIAMLLAYERNAELIVAVGTHSSMIDFLEKGRKGMASTFLVRLKCGAILVDAKGVNKLYKGSVKARHIVQLAIAALIPVVVVVAASPPAKQVFRLVVMRLRFMLGM